MAEGVDIDEYFHVSAAHVTLVKIYNYLFFSRDLGAATTETLNQELAACQQLHELEPDNKCWFSFQIAFFYNILWSFLKGLC